MSKIFLYIFFVLTTVMTNFQLNAMERSSIAKKICSFCSRYYYSSNPYEVTGLSIRCNHELCADCFLESDHESLFEARKKLSHIYSSITEIQCPVCEKWVAHGKKSFGEGSDEYLLEILYAGLRHLKELVRAINEVREQRSSEETLKLLKHALNSRGRSLFDLRCDAGYSILHVACDQMYDIEIIKIILQAAGSRAWELVCMQTFSGQPALIFVIHNAKYTQDYDWLNIIKELLNVGPSNQDRWNHITEQSMRFSFCSPSILAFAQFDVGKSARRQNILKLIESYQPKDQ